MPAPAPAPVPAAGPVSGPPAAAAPAPPTGVQRTLFGVSVPGAHAARYEGDRSEGVKSKSSRYDLKITVKLNTVKPPLRAPRLGDICW